ncbi:MAG: hypothetical protein K5899_00045 [Bacteroidaceae bacterium]|jgi:hypothetical protein|nr:hypothetical protein [Bacteroidaceae bacterium]
MMVVYSRNKQITKNFRLDEFTDSKKARELGIDNHGLLTLQNYVNLEALCVNVLQKVRDMIEVPIHVSSGFRCPAVNSAVHGAKRSQHTKGEAADIYLVPAESKGWTLWNVCKLIVEHTDFDQLIWETRPNGSKWIHVSYVTYRKNRNYAIKTSDGIRYTKLEI